MRIGRILAIFCLLALPLGAQTTTPNIGLEKPAHSTANWDTQMNFNWDLLDTQLSDVPHAGGYVSSIDTLKGSFTFTGAGVSHTGNAYTFSGSGTGIGSIAWTLPSWLTASPSTISASGTEVIAPATGQTSHQVIGTCGTATSFGPCALVGGDIPNNAANTSGTAANLSGTPALPNGTTATTQAAGDNTAKVATDLYVLSQGVGGRTVSSTTDTIATTDRGQSVLYTSTSSTAVTLPDPSTMGSNFVFVASARTGAGVVTFTAAAGTFLNSSGGSSTTLVITQGQTCSISSPDSTNYLARCGAARHLASYTVSTLPSASILGAGAQVMVTDATTFTPGTCTGGGSDTMISVSNGTAWSCH